MGRIKNLSQVFPEAYQAMVALDKSIRSSSIDKWHQELIKIRASHLNGCAYCVDKHTQEAIALGADPRKITLIPVWREATDHFSREEQLIIQLTEQVTLIHQHGVDDNVYDDCISTFGEQLTAQLMMAAITINAWTRIGVGLKLQPKF